MRIGTKDARITRPTSDRRSKRSQQVCKQQRRQHPQRNPVVRNVQCLNLLLVLRKLTSRPDAKVIGTDKTQREEDKQTDNRAAGLNREGADSHQPVGSRLKKLFVFANLPPLFHLPEGQAVALEDAAIDILASLLQTVQSVDCELVLAGAADLQIDDHAQLILRMLCNPLQFADRLLYDLQGRSQVGRGFVLL